MQVIKLEATVPPTINKYIGRSVIWAYQKDKKEYEQENILLNKHLKPKEPLEKCNIDLKFYFKDKRIRDLSNYEKFIFDFLVSGGFIKDDNYTVIVKQTMSGYVDKDSPRVEIELEIR